MMLLFDVQLEFNKRIREYQPAVPVDAPLSEIRSFLLNHERKPAAIERLCEQILVYERRFRARLHIEQRNKLIQQAVEIFASAAIAHRKDRNRSHLSVLQDEARKQARKDVAAQITEVDRSTVL